MPVVERSTGVVVELPETVTVGRMASPGRPRRSVSAADPQVPSGPASAAAETAVVLEALRAQEMDVLDTLPLQPTSAPKGRRRGTSPTSQSATVGVQVPVADHERAVLLLEQDGVYHWQLPEAPESPRPARRTRRAEAAAPQAGVATFRIQLVAAPAAVASQRGVVSKLVHGAVRVFVLKFVAH